MANLRPAQLARTTVPHRSVRGANGKRFEQIDRADATRSLPAAHWFHVDVRSRSLQPHNFMGGRRIDDAIR